MSAPSSRAPAVVVNGVAKEFRLPYERTHTLKERALHPFRKTRYERFEALKDVTFTVPQGEFFGIVGRNGSGKSTLLKCLAGIYRANAGTIGVAGRMSTFIELGVGFNPDLAAYDNVLTNAIMLGLTPREAAKRFDRVLEFAELEEFVDLKIKNYSSGMLVRLAFSVAIEAQADVLLIDEVLAVGDAAFQQKCFDVFNRMREEGRTMLFVTHDMGMVERFCDRAMLLERGHMVCIDKPLAVAQRYLELNFSDASRQNPELGSSISGDRTATIETVETLNAEGVPSETFLHTTSCTVRFRVRFNEETVDPRFSVVIVNDSQKNVFAASNTMHHLEDKRFRAGDLVEVQVRFDVLLAPGRFQISAVVARPGTTFDIMHRVERVASFMVLNPMATGGLVDLPFEIDVRLANPARKDRSA